MYFFYHIPPHIEEGRYDQEDTDKMDFIENLVHEPFYLIPISFPILRFYAKDKERTLEG